MEVNLDKRIWRIVKLMTPEIKKRNDLKRGSITENQPQNIKICFVMLMGHQILEFWTFCAVNLFFSFKPRKNTQNLIILFSSLFVGFGLWCDLFCLWGSIKSFWVWLLLTIIWLHIYQEGVTAINWKLSCNLKKHILMRRKILLWLILLRE